MTEQELIAECKAIAGLIKGGKAYVSASINSEGKVHATIWPNGLGEGNATGSYTMKTFEEAFSELRGMAVGLQDRRRQDALKKKAEAEAVLAALDEEERAG